MEFFKIEMGEELSDLRPLDYLKNRIRGCSDGEARMKNEKKYGKLNLNNIHTIIR